MRQMLLKALASGLIMSLFPFAAISAPAGPSHADSLLRLLAKTHDAVSRERIYVQLADLSGDSLNLAAPYWEAALAEAQKTGDIYGCKEALDFLVRKFAGRDARRAEKYIALADSILPGPRHALFRSSLYAYYIWKLMNNNNAVETVKHSFGIMVFALGTWCNAESNKELPSVIFKKQRVGFKRYLRSAFLFVESVHSFSPNS